MQCFTHSDALQEGGFLFVRMQPFCWSVRSHMIKAVVLQCFTHSRRTLPVCVHAALLLLGAESTSGRTILIILQCSPTGMPLKKELSCLFARSFAAGRGEVEQRANHPHLGSLQCWEDGAMDAGQGISHICFHAREPPLLAPRTSGLTYNLLKSSHTSLSSAGCFR